MQAPPVLGAEHLTFRARVPSPSSCLNFLRLQQDHIHPLELFSQLRVARVGRQETDRFQCSDRAEGRWDLQLVDSRGDCRHTPQ